MLSGQERKILIVEDDRPLADALQNQLKLNGFAVHAEYRGQPAVQYALENSPDLVILDLKLPDMHGHEVAKAIRKSYGIKNLPILVLSGWEKPLNEVVSFASGVNAYLSKPCPSDELMETIYRLLDKKES